MPGGVKIAAIVCIAVMTSVVYFLSFSVADEIPARLPIVLDHLPVKEREPTLSCERYGLRPFANGTAPAEEALPRLYEFFTFTNEDDILHIHLHEMSPVVDYFVIVEAAVTFTGRRRSLVWPTIRDQPRFQPYLSRIVYTNLSSLPGQTPWDKEHFIRNANVRAVLTQPPPIRPRAGDLAVLVDCDEIPRAELLRHVKRCDPGSWTSPAALRMVMFYYNFRTLAPVVWDWAKVFQLTPRMLKHGMRTFQRRAKPVYRFPNAGWHCSYCFRNVSFLVSKIESFSHVEFNKEEYKNRTRILDSVKTGVDLFGRAKFTLLRGDTRDLDAPSCIQVPARCYSTALYLSDVEEFIRINT